MKGPTPTSPQVTGPSSGPSTLSGYTVDVYRHINPTVGKHRLDALQPEHIEHLYAVPLASALNAGTVHHVRRQLERRNWRHGCADPDRCVEKPSQCPQRRDGGLVLAELKTKQSRRTLPLPEPLLSALRQHRRRQREARIQAGTLWCDCGLVFTTVTGRPVAPRDHSLHWTAFLEGLGIRPARLHDARHTAATLLLVQGVDQRVAMSMFGWTSPAMTTRYQHVVPELVEEANRRMGELLWGGGGRGGLG